MDYIGFGKNNEKLQIYDICAFKIDKKQYEGIITYDEDVFSFVFEMDNETLPAIFMSKVDYDSIEKVCGVMGTKLGDRFEFYRELYKNLK